MGWDKVFGWTVLVLVTMGNITTEASLFVSFWGFFLVKI